MTDNQNKIDMNDHYIRHKKTYFKLSIISGILLAVLLPHSNVNGIGHNTLTGKLYFAFLFATFALIMSTGVLIGCVVEAKKREKGIYPRRGF